MPTLWGIGLAVKKSSIQNKFIPLILMTSSCCIAALYLSATKMIFDFQGMASWLFASLTQGCVAWLASWISYEKFLHDRYDTPESTTNSNT